MQLPDEAACADWLVVNNEDKSFPKLKNSPVATAVMITAPMTIATTLLSMFANL